MPDKVKITTELESNGNYDIIIAGGGVAGVAAAITAARRGRKVLLIEKSNILGGLATLGLVNLFVPMCNGRGKQIIFGLADELFGESAKYGFSTLPSEWENGEPEKPTSARMARYFSPYIFALQLTEKIKNAGVDLLFDCIVSEPIMDGNICRGIVTESKSGREYYEAKTVIDTTGDADIMRRAGVPVVSGKNYFMYQGRKITLDSCKKAYDTGDIRNAYISCFGGSINLYGDGQPDGVPMWTGTTVGEVTDYLVTNQLLMLEKLKGDEPKSRDIAQLTMMPNFRTTCHIDGDYTLTTNDKYVHFDDSVCAINDFDNRDILYEVPLRTIARKDFSNIVTAGRSAAAEGYAWDVLRVIPPAILTGQAAAEAAILSIESGRAIADVDISLLQNRLENDDNIMIHFPDSLVPADRDKTEEGHIEGHI